MAILQCEVRVTIDSWPYVKRCRKTATRAVVDKYRIHVEGIRLICEDHAEAMELGFGSKSTEPLSPAVIYYAEEEVKS